MRFFVNVIYTFRYRYNLASRVFPKAKNFVVSTEFPMGLKFYLSQWQIYFSQFIFIDKYLKFKETECLIHYVEFEM